MATLKIISNQPCNIAVDLEPVATIQANIIYRLNLCKGTFIITCTHLNGVDQVVCDYPIADDAMEYLWRVDLKGVQQSRLKQQFGDLPSDEEYHCVQDVQTQMKGIISSDYLEVIPFRYDEISPCGIDECFCASINDKCGIVNKSGKEIVPLCYKAIDFAFADINRLIVMDEDNLYGVIDVNNNIIVPLIYTYYNEQDCENDRESIYGRYIRFRDKNGLYGIVSLDNEQILPFEYKSIPIFNYARYSNYSIAIVQGFNGLYGAVDFISKQTITCKYEKLEIGGWNRYNNHNCPAKIYYKAWKKYDYHSHRMQTPEYLTLSGDSVWQIDDRYRVIPSMYDSDGWRVYGNIIRVAKDDKYGYINHYNNEIIPCIYDDIDYITEDEFDEYMSGAKKLHCVYQGEHMLLDCYGNRTLFISSADLQPVGANRYLSREDGRVYDELGREIVAFRKYNTKENNYNSHLRFLKGLSSVECNGKSGYINADGEIAVPCIYKSTYNLDSALLVYVNICTVIGEVSIKQYRDFCQEINKMGQFIVNNGNEKIEICYKFDFVSDFENGLALAIKDGLYGCIDVNQNIVIPCIYDCISKFDDHGLAFCCKNDKWGFIDRSGEIVIPIIYDEVHSFRNGLSICQKDGAKGIVDITGKVVIPFEYYTLDILQNGLILFSKLYAYEDEYRSSIFSPALMRDEKLWFIEHCENDIAQRTHNELYIHYVLDKRYFQKFSDRISIINKSCWLAKSWWIERRCGKMDINGHVLEKEELECIRYGSWIDDPDADSVIGGELLTEKNVE